MQVVVQAVEVGCLVCEVAQHQEAVVALGSAVGVEAWVVFQYQVVAAVHQGRFFSPQPNQRFVVVQYRVRVGLLGVGVQVVVVRVYREPGRAGGEAGVGVRAPLHGRARVVAGAVLNVGEDVGVGPAVAAFLGGEVFHGDVVELLEVGERVVGHAQFLALVDEGCALHQEVEGGDGGGAFAPVALVVAPGGDGAWDVVVLHEQGVPAFSVQALLPAGQRLFQLGQVQAELGVRTPEFQLFELEQHVEFALVFADPVQCVFDVDAVRLADGHDVVVSEGAFAQVGDVVLNAVDIKMHRRRGYCLPFVRVRHVRQAGGFLQVGDGVDAEAVDALVEPPANHPVHGRAHVVVVPVQVRLLFGEQVQVVFVGGVVVAPDGFTEIAFPVVRRATVIALAPVVPVPFRVVFRRARFPEPGVFVAGVVDHQVEQNAQAALVGFKEQAVEVFHGAEVVEDALVVADVVAVVVVRRWEDRAQPEHVDAEVFEVIQLGDDARQVADAVAVAVHEAAWVDLVDHGFFPPGFLHGGFPGVGG